MKIDWNALGQVIIVSLVATLVVVVLAAFAARLLDSAHERYLDSQPGVLPLRVSAFAMLGMIGAIILFGLWLMVPYFH